MMNDLYQEHHSEFSSNRQQAPARRRRGGNDGEGWWGGSEAVAVRRRGDAHLYRQHICDIQLHLEFMGRCGSIGGPSVAHTRTGTSGPGSVADGDEMRCAAVAPSASNRNSQLAGY